MTGISVVTLATAPVLTGCGSDTLDTQDDHNTPAASFAYGEGEGGGPDGEGEGAAFIDPVKDDAAYLFKLSLLRAHLLISHQLYTEGHKMHAVMHVKYPDSELYTELLPAFQSRSVQGFADELTVLADATTQSKNVASVTAAYQDAVQAITQAETVVSAESKTAAAKLRFVAQLVRTAGQEYAMTASDDFAAKVHSYQDAFGITLVAQSIVDSLDDSLSSKQQAIELIKNVMVLWPELIPEQQQVGEAGLLFGAAARLELLALGQ